MKDILEKFINNYDKTIIIENDINSYYEYENKATLYIELGKQNSNDLISWLKHDFEIDVDVLNLSDGFLVYKFYILNDMCVGLFDVENNGELHEVFTVNTEVFLITRNYNNIYNAYLNSKKWHDKRNIALKYADYKCNRCDSKENLNVHHLNYNNIGHESLGDLEVVCNDCHKQIHGIENSDAIKP